MSTQGRIIPKSRIRCPERQELLSTEGVMYREENPDEYAQIYGLPRRLPEGWALLDAKAATYLYTAGKRSDNDIPDYRTIGAHVVREGLQNLEFYDGNARWLAPMTLVLGAYQRIEKMQEEYDSAHDAISHIHTW